MKLSHASQTQCCKKVFKNLFTFLIVAKKNCDPFELLNERNFLSIKIISIITEYNKKVKKN